MRTKQLLFVTYQNRQSEEGLAYAIGLAKTLGKGLSVLMVRDGKMAQESFSDAMAAAALPETVEHGTAMEVAGIPDQALIERRVEYIKEKCSSSGVSADVRPTSLDAASAIKGTLKAENGIDMILLGPSVTENENFTAKKLGRMIKSATMPIVTIASKAGGNA